MGFELAGRNTIVICQKGLKLSQGVAAWLRYQGVQADPSMVALAWAQAGLPMIPEAKLPPRNRQGQTMDHAVPTKDRPGRLSLAHPPLCRS